MLNIQFRFGFIDHRESQKSIIFSTIMPFYSGFLRFHNELVKTIEQSTFLDVYIFQEFFLIFYNTLII